MYTNATLLTKHFFCFGKYSCLFTYFYLMYAVMVTCNGVSYCHFKWVNTYFNNFSTLISIII